MKISYEIDRLGNYTVYNTADEQQNVYIQSDYDRPSLASDFGWKPCHPDTDGTVDCPRCGTTATALIESATAFLDENQGKVVESDSYEFGYF